MFSEWSSVTPGKYIDLDIDSSPLQIQTDSVVGGDDLVRVRFVVLNSNVGPGIQIWFKDPPEYQINYCSNPTIFTMPDAENEQRIWTFRKQNDRLQLQCNGAQIFDFNFKESAWSDCRDMWSADFAQMRFANSQRWGFDTASDSFRQLTTSKYVP